MSTSSESGDVPMVDAEEHLPTPQGNGHKDGDEVMENGADSEETVQTSNKDSSQTPGSKQKATPQEVSVNQSISKDAMTSDKASSNQPISEDTKMSDETPSKSKASKSSDEKFSVKPVGTTIFKSGGDSPMVNSNRSQSKESHEDNEDEKNDNANGHASTPKTNGTRLRSNSNSVLPSVEGDGADTQYASSNKYKTPAPPEEQMATGAELIRLTKDTALLRDALGQVSHKSAQVILREHWRTFLFDPPDETHVAFILRAGLKNSNPSILNRVIKDDNVFKPPFLEAASQKPALRKRVLHDVTVNELLSDLPREKLDELVAHIIHVAPLRDLVGWLSKGKRLGYQEDDLVSEEDEAVVPNMPPPNQYQQPTYPEVRQPHQYINNGIGMPPVPQAVPKQMDPLLAEQNRQRELAFQRAAAQRASLAIPQVPMPQGQMPSHQTGPLVCNDCGHEFANFPGYHHHITKKPCTRDPPPGGFKWSCPNCLQGFTTKQGNDYHRLKGVCTATDIIPSTGASPSLPSNDGLPRTSSASSVYIPPPVQGPPQSPWISQQPQQAQIPQRPLPSQPPPPQQMVRPPPTATPLPPPPPQRQPPPMASIEIAVPSPKAKKLPPMPPLHTPTPVAPSFVSSNAPPTTRKQAPRKDVRVDPSDLPPERLAALNLDLTELDRKYEEGIADIPAEWDEEARSQRIVSLKNANSSRKSQVRKAYGVTLRMRDKDKQHRNSKRASMHMNGGNDSSSPTGSAATTPAPMAAPTPLIARPHFNGLRNSSNNSPLAGTPPTSGFSPVNAPVIGFSPVNAPRPMMNASPYGTPSSGFGVLKTVQPQFGLSSASENEKKRRHEGIEHERRPGSGAGGYMGGVPAPGPGMKMVEMGSEDAGERYRKGEKVKVHVAGRAGEGNTTRGSSEVIVLDSEDSDDGAKKKEKGKGKGKSRESEG